MSRAEYDLTAAYIQCMFLRVGIKNSLHSQMMTDLNKNKYDANFWIKNMLANYPDAKNSCW